jgi:hypothetical protein
MASVEVPNAAPAPTAMHPTGSEPIAPPRGHPCGNCGSPVDAGDKFCHACGAVQPAAQTPGPSSAPLSPEAVAAASTAAGNQKHFRCQQCGAEVAVDANERSFICPFCDSSYVVELPPSTGRAQPEFVIGFAITPEDAAARFRAWLAEGGWFRPGDLSRARIEGKLRGVYLPFWSFSTLAESTWSAEIGEHWYRTETYTAIENGRTVMRTRQVQETEWWNLSGKHHNYYSGYLVSGSKGLKQADADRIKPYHLPALKRYEPYFLAGWLSEDYSVDRDQAEQICQNVFYGWEQSAVAKFLPGDAQRGIAVQTEFSDTGADLILLPLYLLSYRYGEQVFRFMVNGQTGQVIGDKPLSSWRIGLAIGGAILSILILWLVFYFFSRH